MHGKAETQKHGNAEMWKAWESRNAEMWRCRNAEDTGKQKSGTYCTGVKDLASAYVLCPCLTKQCVSFYLEGVRITDSEGT